jgi:hypothetical protein
MDQLHLSLVYMIGIDKLSQSLGRPKLTNISLGVKHFSEIVTADDENGYQREVG